MGTLEEASKVDSGRRLSIFLPSLNGGGAERTMLNLAHGLSERGHRVDLVLARAEGPYLALASPAVRVVDLRASRVLASLPPLVQYLRRVRPYALLSALDYANIVALWARRLARGPGTVIINEQNTLSQSSRHTPRRRGRWVSRLAAHFYRWANGIVAVSNGVAEDLCQVTGLPRARIKVIPNPVVTPDLAAKVRSPAGHPWLEPGEPPVILGVGRLTRQKDFPLLIQAFAEVRGRHRARLLILGEGPDRRLLEAMISRLGLGADVNLPGFVENPYAYMSRASLFVLSSRWEGLPTVLIEALYCGVSVISTDCPSGPREILAEGRYGRLVPVGEVSALAQAIESALTTDRIQPPTESYQSFTLDTVLNRYESYIDSLLVPE